MWDRTAKVFPQNDGGPRTASYRDEDGFVADHRTGSLVSHFVHPGRTGGTIYPYYSTEITPEIYEKEIARARTFVFYEDVKPLLDKGLIRGGSLENAIVVRGESVMGKEPLRYPDEFVRHKILDIVGDIFLAGCRFLGHVIAVKPGHAANAEMTKALAKRFAQMLSMAPAQVIPVGTGVMDAKDIMQILPHRYPFLMVDRILSFEGTNKCTGSKQVTINEPYFQGHFPGHPVMPGVLQIEAMAQVASILLRKTIDRYERYRLLSECRRR